MLQLLVVQLWLETAICNAYSVVYCTFHVGYSINDPILMYIFCVINYRNEWMKLYQGMIVLAGNQVWWTWEVEDVFHKAKKGGKTAMKVSLSA